MEKTKDRKIERLKETQPNVMAETTSQDSIPLSCSPSAVVIALDFYFLNAFPAFFPSMFLFLFIILSL
ncbi:hypothetical protein BD560DRAFT_417662 [Blakeslea trispora]|nr:hypothetical protein BD560DRAFT_417662 [Blakeslea trispora]